jgi:hypothetical protein
MTILTRVSSDVEKDETNEGDITYKQIPIHEKNNNTKIYKSNNDRWTLHDVKSSHGFWVGELGRH